VNLTYNPIHLMAFVIRRPIPRNERVIIQFPYWIVFNTPISLKEGDQVIVDPNHCTVEIVERAGIAVWRSGWLN
jgi:hypothetical protein